MSEMKKYPICDHLYNDASKHCAALVITENLVKDDNGLLVPAVPTDELRNGTLTFVKTNGKVYGITCWHVVAHFRKVIDPKNPYSHSMRTMVNGFYVVLDRFIRPQPQYGMPDMDVAIRELDPQLPLTIGKVPFDLDAQTFEPNEIEHAYAVGFPESMKYRKMEDKTRYRVSMPQVEILAEIQGMPSQRFTLYSELLQKPEQTIYSGMSGGPIFWSTENNYGIFGIIYEGGVGADDKTIYVYGERVSAEIIKDWIAQL